MDFLNHRPLLADRMPFLTRYPSRGIAIPGVSATVESGSNADGSDASPTGPDSVPNPKRICCFSFTINLLRRRCQRVLLNVLFLCAIKVRESSFCRINLFSLFFQTLLIGSRSLCSVLRRDGLASDLLRQTDHRKHCAKRLRVLQLLLLLFDLDKFRRRGRRNILRQVEQSAEWFPQRLLLPQPPQLPLPEFQLSREKG